MGKTTGVLAELGCVAKVFTIIEGFFGILIDF